MGDIKTANRSILIPYNKVVETSWVVSLCLWAAARSGDLDSSFQVQSMGSLEGFLLSICYNIIDQ